MRLHWLLCRTGKWHAWPHAALRTICGALTLTDLQKHTCTHTTEALPADARALACRVCLRGDPPAAVPVTLRETAQGWLGMLRRHVLSLRYVSEPPREDLMALANLLADIGPVTDAHATAVYTQLCTLVLTPQLLTSKPDRHGHTRTFKKILHVKDALKVLPTAQTLAHVATALRCWQEVTGQLTPTRFRSDQVIQVMLQVPTPEPYVRHLHARDLTHLSAMFHPNTLARAKKDTALRGVFGGSSEYWTRTASQLNVVTE